jgi:hypothetical protein
MGGPSPAHVRMRELLTSAQVAGNSLLVWEEVKVAGHRIDFVVEDCLGRSLGVDVNGDRWHRWEKIRQCDRVKLDRVFAPGVEPLVLGVWWSRLQRSPECVGHAILLGLGLNRLAWWDWAVTFEEMTPTSGARAASLVVAASACDSPPT